MSVQREMSGLIIISPQRDLNVKRQVSAAVFLFALRMALALPASSKQNPGAFLKMNVSNLFVQC